MSTHIYNADGICVRSIFNLHNDLLPEGHSISHYERYDHCLDVGPGFFDSEGEAHAVVKAGHDPLRNWYMVEIKSTNSGDYKKLQRRILVRLGFEVYDEPVFGQMVDRLVTFWDRIRWLVTGFVPG